MVCPPGVLMDPALLALAPSRITLPPPVVTEGASVVSMSAPGATLTLPSPAMKLATPPALYRPFARYCWLVIETAPATSECRFTCAPASNSTPFWFSTSTWPCAVISPRMRVGEASGLSTRFSTDQVGAAAPPALWLKFTWVWRPTLKLCQFSTACGAVWFMVTVMAPVVPVCTIGWVADTPCHALALPGVW